MASNIVNSLLRKLDQPHLADILTDELSGTELNSLLLEVFNRRAASLSAPKLLDHYRKNRLVKPSDIPVLKARKTELEVLEVLSEYSFEPVELSPVTIFGSCSVVAPASQMKILSALRGTEVLADSTNAIALHVSDLRRRDGARSREQSTIRLCAIARHLRTQTISGHGFTPHFRAGCLVTCGRDTGNFGFEKTAVLEHMKAMNTLFLDYYKADSISFRLLSRPGYEAADTLLSALVEYLHANSPGLHFTVSSQPEKQNNYYKGIQYKVDILVNGKQYEIADGGLVDWTQQLLQNKKERMFTTGFGFDLMFRILAGEM